MPFTFNKNFINFKIISYTFTYINAKINCIYSIGGILL